MAAIRASLLASVDARPAFSGITVTGSRLNADRALAAQPNEAAFPPDAGIDPARLPAAPPAAQAMASPRDTVAPLLATRFASSFRLRTVLRRGVPIRTRCSETCSLRLEVTVARAQVPAGRASQLKSPVVVVGRARGSFAMAGSRVVRVRVSARSRRLLARVRPRRLTLRVRATDPSGNRASVRRLLRLRG